MKISRKLRFLSVILAAAILAGQFGIVNANAAQGVEQAPVGTKLSGFRITDLDRPVPGRDLDFKARVRTNENVTWEIPVIWTDENGNTAYEAKPGHTYYPNFAFYIPQGYSIDAKVLAGKSLVKLPDFLIELYGMDSVLFASDASLGVTYITFTQAVQALAEKEKDARKYYETLPSPAVNVPKTSTDESRDEGKSSPSPAPAPVSRISETVRIHCSQDIIDKFSKCPEVLEGVVTLIKNKLQPQAVALLANSFDAFGNVEDRESTFGKEIGLYIYNKTGNVGGVTVSANQAVAFLICGYDDGGDDPDVFKYAIAIDTDSFMRQDDNGIWHYIPTEEAVRDNTIVHEMMHAFMDDYTRRGMKTVDVNDIFPLWFKEGMAVAVENAYQDRTRSLQSMGTLSEDNYNNLLDRFTDTVTYTAASVTSRYTSSESASNLDKRYDLCHSGETENLYSAYTSGYLAVVYLGYLAAVHENIYTGSSTAINTDSIRNGLSRILTWIHKGSSLDSVIRYISTPDSVMDSPETYTNNESTHYASTDDFQAAFIKGPKEAGQDGYAGAIFTTGNTEGGSGRSVLGSSQFVATYLNYLESQSGHGEGCTSADLANGSILRSNQHYVSPLNTTDEPVPGIYVITDKPGAGDMVESTADDVIAFDNTGGKITNANEAASNNVVSINAGSETSAAAQKIETEEPASAGESSSDTSEPAGGSTSEAASSEEPACEHASGSPATEAIATEEVAATIPAPVAEESAPVDIISHPANAPVTDPAETVFLPDTGDLIIAPQDIDAITPEEIAPAVTEPVSGDVTPLSDDAPSPDEGSSDGGSGDDGGSDDGGDSGDDSGSEE